MYPLGGPCMNRLSGQTRWPFPCPWRMCPRRKLKYPLEAPYVLVFSEQLLKRLLQGLAASTELFLIPAGITDVLVAAHAPLAFARALGIQDHVGPAMPAGLHARLEPLAGTDDRDRIGKTNLVRPVLAYAGTEGVVDQDLAGLLPFASHHITACGMRMLSSDE